MKLRIVAGFLAAVLILAGCAANNQNNAPVYTEPSEPGGVSDTTNILEPDEAGYLLNVTDDIPFEPDRTVDELFGRDARVSLFPNTGYMAYFEAISTFGDQTNTSGYITGVYDNAEPRQLLYRIYDYGAQSIMNLRFHYISSTGTHHAKLYSRYFGFLNYRDRQAFFETGIVLRFYEMGVPYRQWRVSDLVDDVQSMQYPSPLPPIGGWHLAGGVFNYVHDILHISTLEGRAFAFCIYTGEKLERPENMPSGAIEVGSMVIITAQRYFNSDETPFGEDIPVWLRMIPHVVLEDNGTHFLLEAEDGVRSEVCVHGVRMYADWRGGERER